MLKGTFVIDLLKPFSGNLRKELTKTPKVYLKDLGLITFYNNRSELPINQGHLVENFIYNTLKNNSSSKLNYYRTLSGSEIDFIISGTNEKLYTVEVKYQNKIKSSATKAMQTFAENYPTDLHIIVSKEELEYKAKDKVLVLPAIMLPFWKFN